MSELPDVPIPSAPKRPLKRKRSFVFVGYIIIFLQMIFIGVFAAIGMESYRKLQKELARVLQEKGLVATPLRLTERALHIASLNGRFEQVELTIKDVRIAYLDLWALMVEKKPLIVQIGSMHVTLAADEPKVEAALDKDKDKKAFAPEKMLAKWHQTVMKLTASTTKELTFAIAQLSVEGQWPIRPSGPVIVGVNQERIALTIAANKDLLLHANLRPKEQNLAIDAALEVLKPQKISVFDILFDFTEGSDATTKSVFDIVISRQGRDFPFATDAILKKIGVAHPYFAKEPWFMPYLQVQIAGWYGASPQTLTFNIEAALKSREDDSESDILRVINHAEIKSYGQDMSFDLTFKLPRGSCLAFNHLLTSQEKPVMLKAIGGEYELDAVFKASKNNLAQFYWQPKAQFYSCLFEGLTENLNPEFLNGPFQFVRHHPDDAKTVSSVLGEGELEIPPLIKQALIASEDLGFSYHRGVDLEAIQNAMRLNFQAQEIFSGASTITMQLARTLFLNQSKTVMRKAEEIAIALYLEQILSKERIMELYLSIVPFGPEVFGITDAAMVYFKKSYRDLSLKEALTLMQLLPSPYRRFKSICEKGVLAGVSRDRIPGLLSFMQSRNAISYELMTLEQSRLIAFRVSEEECQREALEKEITGMEWVK